MATKKSEPRKRKTEAGAGREPLAEGAKVEAPRGGRAKASGSRRGAAASRAAGDGPPSAKPATPPRKGAVLGPLEDETTAELEGAAGDELRDDDADVRDPDEGEVVEVVGELVEDVSVEADDAALDEPARISALPGDDVALSRRDPLQAYLREVQRHPLLTPEEERALTVHYAKTGDVRTAARLVTANLRLVVKLAYEYRRAYKNIMDLIQEGNIGLMQAVKRYDPYRGVKLSSYAAWWIRAYILRFILNNWRLVKLGTTQAQRKLFFNLNKEKAKLSAMGIEPTAAEIANRLNVDEKEVVDMDRRLASGEASLDAPVGDTDGRAVSRLEMLPSATSGPDVAFEQNEMGELVKERLQRFRETLKGKDVIIFDKRMAAEEPLTLQELGDEFGISRERVRQLEARLATRLRTFLQQELGDAVGGPG